MVTYTNTKAFELCIRPKILIVYQNTFNDICISSQGIFTTMIAYVIWRPFCTIIKVLTRDKANHSGEKLNK